MSLNMNQIDKKNDCYPKNDFYSLIKVFGFGSKNNYSITVNNLNGLIAWVSGPYVIFYDLSNDKQVSFLKNINNKILSCVKFSKNGKYLATGEGNCRNGGICLYNINYNNQTNEESHKLILENKPHKYGIDKLLFIKDDKYILSIGNNDDKLMNIMNIQNKQNIFSSRFNRPILSSEVSDRFMVLGGNGFIKIYKHEKLLNAYPEELDNKNLMEKYLVDLAKLKEKAFVSVAIYDYENEKNIKKIFFLTLDGYLVEMKSNDTKLNRWVFLRANKGLTITIWNNMIGCGLSDGIYRIFNADNLNHIVTLQRPPPLGKLNDYLNNKNGNINIPNNINPIFADIIATSYNNFHKKLIVIYSDKTFFIWDINELKNIYIYRYNIFQCGGIKAMDYFISKEENLIKIVTCSDDKTVIYWNIKLDEFLDNPISDKKNHHIMYSKYIRHIFYFCKNYNHLKILSDDILNKNNNNKSNDSNEENSDNFNLTSIRFSPDSKYLVIGDSIGNIFIYSLITFEEVISIPTHSGDVNSIDTIKDFEKNESYLSTGGADSFISIVDISKDFSNLDIYNNNILEKMGSSVINVVFCIDKNKVLKLITAEQNSTITFFLVNNNNNSLLTLQKFYDDKLKTYCLNYARPIQKIISGHNGKISIWKTSSNTPHKHFQVNKGDKLLDNFRIASDSKGVMFATSNNDKIIRIRAFHDGKLLSKIPVSESITSLGFILEDNYLIATSIEGYLYFYKLNQDLIKNLQNNNDLINSTEEKKIINNKLKLLQKFMENDASLSKNEQVKYLLDKFQRSEETTVDDLKILNVFVKEGKKKHQDIHEENKLKKTKEIIELKEEKPNNNDDQENENNDEENKDNINNNQINNINNFLLNKSKIFEKELRENNNILSRKSIGRVSLTDTYKKNIGIDSKKFPKIKIIDKDSDKKYIIDIPKVLEKTNENGKVTTSEEHLVKENYEKDNEKENDNENTNEKENAEENKIKKDMSKSQLKIMELREMINDTNNLINNVDLKVKKESSRINSNNFVTNEITKKIENMGENNINNNDNKNTNEVININNNTNKNFNKEIKEIKNDILDLEDIQLENKKQDKNIIESNSNININEELEKKNLENDGIENINQKEDLNINSIQSSFKEQIIENSQYSFSQKYQNLTITQTTFGLKSLLNNKKYESLKICRQTEIFILGNIISRESFSIEKELNLCNIKNDKKNLINYIININIDNIKNKDTLNEIEKNIELLLNKIRDKLGYKNENPYLERILDKYSLLLLNRLENLNKNK